MQTNERPVFRQDLVAEAIEEQGARFIDVMDPDSGDVFRFFEVEYSIACAMDGQRDVAGLVRWAQEELGLTPSAEEVETVIATLTDLRFVEASAPRPSEVPEVEAEARDREATAARYRWKIVPQLSSAPPFDDRAPGPPRWRVILEKGSLGKRRNATPAGDEYLVDWTDNGFTPANPDRRDDAGVPRRPALPHAAPAALGDRLPQAG
jgi:hypothetical protein